MNLRAVPCCATFSKGTTAGWLEDPALVILLDRLVAEKLQAEAEAVAAEGWKWIEVATDLPYGYSHGLWRFAGDPAPMPDEECAAHAAPRAGGGMPWPERIPRRDRRPAR